MKARVLTIAAMVAGGCAIAAGGAAAAPTASSSPTVTGTAAVGQTLTCQNGTWSSGAGSYTYEWELADGAVVIGSKQTIKLGARTMGLAVDCVVTAKDSSGTSAKATSAPVTVAGLAPKITITKESSSNRTLVITGKITPRAAAAGGSGSLVLYRESASGPQQLTFNEADTYPSAKGTFTLTVTGEPTGRHSYVLQYVPGVAGYATQVTISRKFRIRK
jgi:hypothetical protein